MIKHRLPAALFASSVLLFSTGVAALGNLENPQPRVEARSAAITGWHCTSRSIEVRVDGVSLGLAGAGTSRDDTLPVCGHSDTGFSLLFNYNLLQGGTHKVDAYADGVLRFCHISGRISRVGVSHRPVGCSHNYGLSDKGARHPGGMAAEQTKLCGHRHAAVDRWLRRWHLLDNQRLVSGFVRPFAKHPAASHLRIRH